MQHATAAPYSISAALASAAPGSTIKVPAGRWGSGLVTGHRPQAWSASLLAHAAQVKEQAQPAQRAGRRPAWPASPPNGRQRKPGPALFAAAVAAQDSAADWAAGPGVAGIQNPPPGVTGTVAPAAPPPPLTHAPALPAPGPILSAPQVHRAAGDRQGRHHRGRGGAGEWASGPLARQPGPADARPAVQLGAAAGARQRCNSCGLCWRPSAAARLRRRRSSWCGRRWSRTSPPSRW
jgi:hypothetical protein